MRLLTVAFDHRVHVLAVTPHIEEPWSRSSPLLLYIYDALMMRRARHSLATAPQ
eukprot:COSAG01_NODE_1553_length_9931_cov_3.092657_6_plen_54_part_00